MRTVVLRTLVSVLACAPALHSIAAPAPVARPPVPLEKAVLGHWTLAWGSMEGTAVVSPQGFWGCSLNGTHYQGSWEIEGGILTLRECRLDDPSRQECVYKITLAEPVRGKPGVAGVIEGQGSAFALRP